MINGAETCINKITESDCFLEPTFDKKGRYYFRDYKRRRICLNKGTWELKSSKPERKWVLRYNFEKIVETLKRPDFVRLSSTNPKSKLYYKKYENFNIRRDVVKSFTQYMLIVVFDDSLIQTIYTTAKPKEGEQIWPISQT